MRLRSRGLGKRELVLDFREYDVIRDGDEVKIVGTIRDPVNWDFSIRVCDDDIGGIVQVMLHRNTLRMALRSLFRRKKKGHWGESIEEHHAKARECHKATVERYANGEDNKVEKNLAGRRSPRPTSTQGN